MCAKVPRAMVGMESVKGYPLGYPRFVASTKPWVRDRVPRQKSYGNNQGAIQKQRSLAAIHEVRNREGELLSLFHLIPW